MCAGVFLFFVLISFLAFLFEDVIESLLSYSDLNITTVQCSFFLAVQVDGIIAQD
uniref:Uncharacterized protein n=1 Tax=Phakopsora pachyrhizi TaxID=170000 RepID=A0A0S1MJU9_PHAPC